MTGGKTGTKKPVPAFIVHSFPFELSLFPLSRSRFPVPAFTVHAFPFTLSPFELSLFTLSPFAIKSNPSQQNHKYEIKDRKISSRLPLEKKGVFCNNPRYAFGASPLV